jgi:hypothetical protein
MTCPAPSPIELADKAREFLIARRLHSARAMADRIKLVEMIAERLRQEKPAALTDAELLLLINPTQGL